MNVYPNHFLAVALGVLAGLSGIVAGAQAPESYEAEARALVEAVMDRSAETIEAARGEDLAAWAESVIGRALEESGAAAGTGSVLVEAHAPGVGQVVSDEDLPSARTSADMLSAGSVRLSSAGPVRLSSAGPARLPSAGPEVIVFMSLAVPGPSWRQWSREAARIGAPMVLRGVLDDGFMATVRAIHARHVEDGAGAAPLQGAASLQGAALDPRLFRLFRVSHVPAVAVVPGGVPPCASPGCSTDTPPPHDLVTGNIGLEAALEAIAREGEPGRDTARRQLTLLRGETE